MSGLQFDLHTHSTASDGSLAPAELVQRAAACGIGVLALTDHDQTAGLSEAAGAAREAGIEFVPGIELSVTWSHQTFHIVGLGIDPDCASLQAGIERARGIVCAVDCDAENMFITVTARELNTDIFIASRAEVDFRARPAPRRYP